jgi:hypothetical protein
MISIIACSRNAQLLKNISENIARTIGVPYELIPIDNSLNQFGICKAYNMGGDKARYDILCFMHEDISFETNSWGIIVVDMLRNKSTGILGIAGGDAKSLVPSSWSVPARSCEVNIIQHRKNGNPEKERILITMQGAESDFKEVCVLDGVWLCTRKEIFEEYRFDEINFPGFHGYDIDYSLQISRKYKAYVLFNIQIEHYSEGNPNKEWVKSAISVSEKWRSQLPASIYPLERSEFALHHWKTIRNFMEHLIRLQYSGTIIIKYFLTYSFSRYFSLRRFLSIGKYILTEMKKRK